MNNNRLCRKNRRPVYYCVSCLLGSASFLGLASCSSDSPQISQPGGTQTNPSALEDMPAVRVVPQVPAPKPTPKPIPLTPQPPKKETQTPKVPKSKKSQDLPPKKTKSNPLPPDDKTELTPLPYVPKIGEL